VPDYLPVFLDLRGRRCLVVGGGPIGERRVRDLLACGAIVTLVSPTLTGGLAELVAGGRLDHRARPFRAGDVRGCALVLAASGVAAVDARVASAGRRSRALVNAADRPRHCDFIFASVLRRGPLQIAVSTGGHSPTLAREIRRRLEPLFPDDCGALVERVGAARRGARARAVSAPARLAAAESLARRALSSAAGRRIAAPRGRPQGSAARGAPFRTVRPVTGTGSSSACITKQPRSALRTTRATRSGGSGESISSVVSAPSIRARMVSFSTEPSTR
jgi:precorrin-2 dehydrogenase/sirohydrochlorin ferrochelatase